MKLLNKIKTKEVKHETPEKITNETSTNSERKNEM